MHKSRSLPFTFSLNQKKVNVSRNTYIVHYKRKIDNLQNAISEISTKMCKLIPIRGMLCSILYTQQQQQNIMKQLSVWNTKNFKFTLKYHNFITKYKMPGVDILPPTVISFKRTH